MTRKVVSLSLFDIGSHVRTDMVDRARANIYLNGARNIALDAQRILPDFVVRIYHDDLVNIDSLRDLPNVQLVPSGQRSIGNVSGMFWRFLAADDCEVAIIRDADMSLTANNQHKAILHWLKHPSNAMTIRLGSWSYAPYNNVGGGEIAIRGGLPDGKKMADLMADWSDFNRYPQHKHPMTGEWHCGGDIEFLRKRVLPLIAPDHVVYTHYTPNQFIDFRCREVRVMPCNGRGI